ncbi:hypothetical protein VTI74DRAFT_2956 [Chaetomium olivicolor]
MDPPGHVTNSPPPLFALVPGDMDDPPITMPTSNPALLDTSAAMAIGAHLMEIASIRTLGVSETKGTVLAVVTFPKGDRSSKACDGKSWDDIRFRMSHEKLMSLGSKKIQGMFTPRAQARFRRRLGLEHYLPDGVEYVIDFTPPAEGPELADLTAALWLPRVVKIWFLAGHYLPEQILEMGRGTPTRPLADKAVGPVLVLGHDDVCKSAKCLTDFDEWHVKDGVRGIIDENPVIGHYIPEWRKIEDYCPIRHRLAIVRILKLINGGDLHLNSAVRMWTVAQVAISLDIPHVVVDHVAQWLVAPPNTKFIEICPEKAFQLAYALKIPSVLIPAFKILVNERAIDYAASNPTPGRPPPLTWAQRRRDDYGDYPSDPVEYASRAMAERMSSMLSLLQSPTVFSNLPISIPEWDKLVRFGELINSATNATGAPVVALALGAAHEILATALQAAFHDWIADALRLDNFSGRLGDLMAAQRAHYIPEPDRTPLIDLYQTLNPAQKLLTPFFWERLSWPESRARFLERKHDSRKLSNLAERFNDLWRVAGIPVDYAHPSLAHLQGPSHSAYGKDPHLGFDINEFYRILVQAVRRLCEKVLAKGPNQGYQGTVDSLLGGKDRDGIPFFLSDHLLLALEDDEMKYLPIWANGLDDGSGGVFQEVVPEAEMGPSEPGPGYHTGYTAAGTGAVTEVDDGWTMDGVSYPPSMAASTVADLGVGALALSGKTSTAGRSVAVQQSGASAAAATTTIQSRASFATPSEAFSADVEDGVYADARFAQPAAHQAQGQAIERYVDEADERRSSAQAPVPDPDGMTYSDEEMEFESDGSSTLDGFEEIDADEAL